MLPTLSLPVPVTYQRYRPPGAVALVSLRTLREGSSNRALVPGIVVAIPLIHKVYLILDHSSMYEYILIMSRLQPEPPPRKTPSDPAAASSPPTSPPPPPPEPYTIFTVRHRTLISAILGFLTLASPLTATIYFPRLPLLCT